MITGSVLDLARGLSDRQLDSTPMCRECGWAQGGLDSWNGRACKCGLSSPTFRTILRSPEGAW